MDILGVVAGAQHRWTDAEHYHLEALAIDEEMLGAGHPNVAVELYNLATIYATQRRYRDSEPLFQRALAINERTLGANHLRVATTLDNYAQVLAKTGRRREATEMQKRAEAIRRASGLSGRDVIDIQLLRAERRGVR
jgi:tetratricopeptide (TPR) repeat protein